MFRNDVPTFLAVMIVQIPIDGDDTDDIIFKFKSMYNLKREVSGTIEYSGFTKSDERCLGPLYFRLDLP